MKVEDIATELYELVNDRKSTEEIIKTFSRKANKLISTTNTELEDSIRRYKDTRKGLEDVSKKIKETIFKEPDFPDPLDFGGGIDFGMTLQKSVKDLIAKRNQQQSKSRLNRAKGKVKVTWFS